MNMMFQQFKKKGFGKKSADNAVFVHSHTGRN